MLLYNLHCTCIMDFDDVMKNDVINLKKMLLFFGISTLYLAFQENIDLSMFIAKTIVQWPMGVFSTYFTTVLQIFSLANLWASKALSLRNPFFYLFYLFIYFQRVVAVQSVLFSSGTQIGGTFVFILIIHTFIYKYGSNNYGSNNRYAFLFLWGHILTQLVLLQIM